MQTAASDHRWLALLGVLLFPLLAAVRQAFPNVPPRFLPLISLCGGLAAGVGHALAMGAGWEDALWSAAIGLAGGGTSVAFYEATKKRAPGAPPSSGNAPTGQDGPTTPKSPRPGGDELSRLAWASCLLVLWAFAGTCLACTAAQQKIAGNVTVPVCEVGAQILTPAIPAINASRGEPPAVNTRVSITANSHGLPVSDTQTRPFTLVLSAPKKLPLAPTTAQPLNFTESSPVSIFPLQVKGERSE